MADEDDNPRRLRVVRRQGEWWIRNMPDPTCPMCGPYTTRKEAEEVATGLRKSLALKEMKPYLADCAARQDEIARSNLNGNRSAGA